MKKSAAFWPILPAWMRQSLHRVLLLAIVLAILAIPVCLYLSKSPRAPLAAKFLGGTFLGMLVVTVKTCRNLAENSGDTRE